MIRQSTIAILLCVSLLAVVSGCGRLLAENKLRVAPRDSLVTENQTTEAGQGNAEPTAEPATGKPMTEQPASAEDDNSSGIDKDELAEVLEALEEVGKTDPELQRELMANLREVMQQTEDDPLLWSRVRGTMLAAISYRKRLAERQRKEQQRRQPPTGPTTLTPATDETSEYDPPAQPVPLPESPVATEPPIQPRPSVANQYSRTGQPSAAPPTPLGSTVAFHQPSIMPAPQLNPPPINATPAFGLPELPAHYQAQRTNNSAELAVAKQPSPWGFGQDGGALTANNEPLTAALTGDWQRHLKQAIVELEAKTGGAPQTSDQVNQHAALRLLYLLAGQREKAVTPIAGLSPELQDFWSNQMYGMSIYRDLNEIEDPQRRATEAATHLRYASDRLGEAGILEVRNLALCKSAQGFGLYEPFERHQFQPRQQVVLYLEVENFKTERSEKGHSLSLSGTYKIVDQVGKVQFAGELGTYREQCRTRRRDLYYSSLINLPGSLPAGSYSMQVTVADNVSRKTATSSIAFQIAGNRTPSARLFGR